MHSDGVMLRCHLENLDIQPSKHTIGTEDPAVGPGIEHAQQEKGDPQEDHQERSIHAEDPHKGIVAADNKITAGGCK